MSSPKGKEEERENVPRTVHGALNTDKGDSPKSTATLKSPHVSTADTPRPGSSRSSSISTAGLQETPMTASSNSSGASFFARIFSPFQHRYSGSDRPNMARSLSSPLVARGRRATAGDVAELVRSETTGEEGDTPKGRKERMKKRSSSALKKLIHSDNPPPLPVASDASIVNLMGGADEQEGEKLETAESSKKSMKSFGNRSRTSLPSVSITPSSPTFDATEGKEEKERGTFSSILIPLRPAYMRSQTEGVVPTLKSTQQVEEENISAESPGRRNRPLSFHGTKSKPLHEEPAVGNHDSEARQNRIIGSREIDRNQTITASTSARTLLLKKKKQTPIPIIANRASRSSIGIAIDEGLSSPTHTIRPDDGVSVRSLEGLVSASMGGAFGRDTTLDGEEKDLNAFLTYVMQTIFFELVPKELTLPLRFDDNRASTLFPHPSMRDSSDDLYQQTEEPLTNEIDVGPNSSQSLKDRQMSNSSSTRPSALTSPLSYELLSASSLNLPTTSVAGMWRLTCCQNWLHNQTYNGTPELQEQDVFDLGTVIQSVADVANVLAEGKGVEIVLYHGRRIHRPGTADSGGSGPGEEAEDGIDDVIGQVIVKGDEKGFSLVLLNTLKQILAIAEPGCAIEIGLKVSHVLAGVITSPNPPPRSLRPMETAASPTSSSFSSSTATIRCIVDFYLVPPFGSRTHQTPDTPFVPPIDFSSGLMGVMLKYLGLSVNAYRDADRLQWRLTGKIARGGSSVKEEGAEEMKEAGLEEGKEPTILELIAFANSTIRGRRVIVHASELSDFAKHLTTYLASWGTDITFVPIVSKSTGTPGVDVDNPPNSASSGKASLQPGSEPVTPILSRPAPNEPKQAAEKDAAFIIIDDDTETLTQQIQLLKNMHLQLRMQNNTLANKRTSALAGQTGRKKEKAPAPISEPKTMPAIVYFTSLGQYRRIKEIIQTILATSNALFPLPQVIVVPKPVGPRRLLTAFHTAVKRPKVDPYLAPIATSPSSPGGHYFSSGGAKLSPATQGTDFDTAAGAALQTQGLTPPTGGLRTPGGTLIATGKPHSPLSQDQLEYFSRTTSDNSPSEGLVIHSPDGRAAGLFFQPAGSSQPMERTADGARGDAQATTPLLLGLASPAISLPSQIGLGSHQRGSGSSSRELNGSPHSDPTTSPRAQRLESYAIGATLVPSPHELPPPFGTVDSPLANLPVRVLSAPPGLLEVESTSTSPPSPPKGMHHTQSYSPSRSRGETLPVPAEHVVSSPPMQPPPATPKLSKRRGSNAAAAAKGSKKNLRKNSALVPPINVLIVEDNPINQNILSTFMKRKGIKYGVANNGEEAVEKWRKGGFDLVLMDIQLPVKDGIEATKEIRQMERASGIGTYPSTPPSDGNTSATPSTGSSSLASSPFRLPVIIVALTASSLQSDKVAALAAGCNDFITKPVSFQWLNQKLMEWGSMAYLSNFSQKRGDQSRSQSPGSSTVDVSTVRTFDEHARDVANNLRIVHHPHNNVVDREGSQPPIPPVPPIPPALIAAGDVETPTPSSSDVKTPTPASKAPSIQLQSPTPTLPATSAPISQILMSEVDANGVASPVRPGPSPLPGEIADRSLEEVVQEGQRLLDASKSRSQSDSLAQVIENSGVVDSATVPHSHETGADE
ncbi:hypothetical protein BT69DRAFT_1335543 [Atractiella rhizophila]|nr:hypothetical protein BT69DRAFT_1335543 [Atractiella rhizophila]